MKKNIISSELEHNQLKARYYELVRLHVNFPEKQNKEINLLKSSIVSLQEEKRRVESELLLLNSDFYKNLSERYFDL